MLSARNTATQLPDRADPKTVTGRDIKYDNIDFIPSKDFIKVVCSNRLGFRRAEGPVGNSQMHDPKAMDEALRRSLQQGFTSVKIFRICSGLKRDSAQDYLDSLTKGDHPRLRRVKNGNSYLYFPIQEESPAENRYRPRGRYDFTRLKLLVYCLCSPTLQHPFSQGETFNISEATAHSSLQKRTLCEKIDLQNTNC